MTLVRAGWAARRAIATMVLLAAAVPAFAWNGGAHEAVALLAYQNLAPAARESAEVATREVYTLDESGPTRPLPSDRYLANAARVGRGRAALAAYRLAAVLNTVLADGAPRVTTDRTGAEATERDTVYATRTGKKYHRLGCNGLRLSSIPMSRADAVAKGLGPCGGCKP